MFSLLVTLALALLVSVAAFAPASRMATTSALKMSFEDAIGAQPPLVLQLIKLYSTNIHIKLLISLL